MSFREEAGGPHAEGIRPGHPTLFPKQWEKRGERLLSRAEAWSAPLSGSGRRGVVGVQDTGVSSLRRTRVLGDVSCLDPSLLACCCSRFRLRPSASQPQPGPA